MDIRLINAIAYRQELETEKNSDGRSEEFKDAIEVAIADLGDMPTIDPVHAAGGCYCYECDNHCSDGSCCIRRDSWGARLKVGDHDFCSDGSRNKEKTNET